MHTINLDKRPPEEAPPPAEVDMILQDQRQDQANDILTKSSKLLRLMGRFPR